MGSAGRQSATRSGRIASLFFMSQATRSRPRAQAKMDRGQYIVTIQLG